MTAAIITGSCGLVGSEAVRYFAGKFDVVFGIDNNEREQLFGNDASVSSMADLLKKEVSNYVHIVEDITQTIQYRNVPLGHDVKLIIHCAAQPSHDWAASNPLRDFEINALGTLNVLEATRKYFPEAVFIHCSTNKVYGDRPNYEPHIPFNESLSIDQTTHSLFGASKLAADIYVQEYGRYFGMKTGIFRCGCITGPNHAGAEQHGFLSYLVKCVMTDKPYIVYGYEGKQVRDNIHSYDLITAFDEFYKNPKPGEVYNIGGGLYSNCSMLEAINIVQELSGKKLQYGYSNNVRKGDHYWYVSDVTKFCNDYPDWSYKYTLRETIKQIIDGYNQS